MKQLLLLLAIASLSAGCRTYDRDHCHKRTTTPLECSEHREGTKGHPVGRDASTALPAHLPPPTRSTVETTANLAAGETLELKAEDMTVDKRTVSNGSVRVRKYVVSEQKSVPIEVCREDYVVERIPASGQPTTSWGGGDVVIDIPLTRQTATAVITPRVYETLRIRKTVDCVTEQVTGTVRTEKFEVIKQ